MPAQAGIQRDLDPIVVRNVGNGSLKTGSIGPGQKTSAIHDLRHTFASWRMMNGGDLYELAKILGDLSIKMTEHYEKLARQHIARTTAREIWKLLEPICKAVADRCSRIVLARES